jgi:hypothetical protein
VFFLASFKQAYQNGAPQNFARRIALDLLLPNVLVLNYLQPEQPRKSSLLPWLLTCHKKNLQNKYKQAVKYEGHLHNPNKLEDAALHKEGAALNNLRE